MYASTRGCVCALTSSAVQWATRLACTPATPGSSLQCCSQHRGRSRPGWADIADRNTDWWRACCRLSTLCSGGGRVYMSLVGCQCEFVNEWEWEKEGGERKRKWASERVRRECLQKVFTPLDFSHMLLCYSLNLKWIALRFCVTGLHTIPHNASEIMFLEMFTN